MARGVVEQEVCRDFLKGACFRENCRYSHTTSDGPHATSLANGSVLHSRQPICRDYQNGRCFRASCRFFHGTATELAAMQAAAAAAAATSASNAALTTKGSSAASNGGKDSTASTQAALANRSWTVMQQAANAGKYQDGMPPQGPEPQNGMYSSHMSPHAVVAHQAALWSQMTMQQAAQQHTLPLTQHPQQGPAPQQHERDHQSHAAFFTALNQQQRAIQQQQHQQQRQQNLQQAAAGAPLNSFTTTSPHQPQHFGVQRTAAAFPQHPGAQQANLMYAQQAQHPSMPPTGQQPLPPQPQQQQQQQQQQCQQLPDGSVMVVSNDAAQHTADGQHDSAQINISHSHQHLWQQKVQLPSPQYGHMIAFGVDRNSGCNGFTNEFSDVEAAYNQRNASAAAHAQPPPQQFLQPQKTVQQEQHPPVAGESTTASTPSQGTKAYASGGVVSHSPAPNADQGISSAMSNSESIGIFSDFNGSDDGNGDPRLGRLYSLFSQ